MQLMKEAMISETSCLSNPGACEVLKMLFFTFGSESFAVPIVKPLAAFLPLSTQVLLVTIVIFPMPPPHQSLCACDLCLSEPSLSILCC